MLIGREAFFSLYRGQYGRLTQVAVSGLSECLNRLEHDHELSADLRWAAYVLATIKHETAGTFHPVEEIGKGRGHDYGKPVNGHVYYGRGYAQLTWERNYATMGKRLNVDLVQRPELALRPDVAWAVLSLGMREGLFTGHRLEKFIHATKCDYFNARRIINGTDRAALIAGYAIHFEHYLRVSLEAPNG
jgi:putative chitinase